MNTTRTIAVAALIVGCGLALPVASAQQAGDNGSPTQPVGGKRTELQRHDLSTPGREVVQVRVEIGPTPFRHSHPGEEIVYVLQGSIEYQIEGKPPATLKAGNEAHGLDVDRQGEGAVAEPRLYQLIRQPGPIVDHTFEIEFLDSGITTFSFTFG